MAAASMKAAKCAIRAEMKKQLKAMTAEDRLRQSKIVLDKTEVSTEPIIRHIINDGKECFIPKYDDQSRQMDMVKLSSLEELEKLPMTKWRIKQHTDFDPREEALVTGGIDLLVVPAVAFTAQGARLGHGKGYYDIYYSRCLKAQAQSLTL
ncbi:hypothetical protein HPB52_024476 [Rhipicephalus sanguineus]|uniref:5-formyltetrahydrofolate cyclo-ligase n=1 Tax=Rhipicephalus sanguineus TaxID=34632 RepID=A0A9D4PAK5_RHISA|nr:hypothetical protein HPB52_024476 [Rhipicephalus sanguineus]